MTRHYVGRWNEPSKLQMPERYKGHALGYKRFELIDHTTTGSAVHMGLALVELEPGGYLSPIVHAFEKGFFVLDGGLLGHLNGRDVRITSGDYGVIPMGTQYSWRNNRSEATRLLEMMSPQPKPDNGYFEDTYFARGGTPPAEGVVPDLKDPMVSKYLGHFDDSQLPPSGSEIQAVGARGGAIHGIALKELIDRMLGAQHISLFVVQFQPGGEGTVHDHMFEESYFLVSGEAEATLDGQRYSVKAGDYVWTGVGCMHGFKNTGSTPVRWIETQSPLPTPIEAFRFKAQWEYLQKKVES